MVKDFLMSIFNKKFLCIFLLSLTVLNKSEYLFYKIDKLQPNKKLPVGYADMSDKDKREMRYLYKDELYPYLFPVVIKQYDFFYPSIKKTYLEALSQDFGLFHFVKNRIEKKSESEYSLVWVPTTIFEMYALYIFLAAAKLQLPEGDRNYCPNISVDFGKKAELWLGGKAVVKDLLDNPVMNSNNKEQLRDSQLSLYFVTSDYMLQHYQKNGDFMGDVLASNKDDIQKIVKNLGQNLKQPDLKRNNGKEQNPIWQDPFLPIVERSLLLEQQAHKKNQFLLFRGTNGFQDRIDMIVPDKSNGWSYAYSLFAGSLFDRFVYPVPARTLDYMVSDKIGYVVSVNIADIFGKSSFFSHELPLSGLLNSAFYLPILITLQSVFGTGEYFHPRLKRISSFMPNYKQMIQSWVSYLSQAHIVKVMRAGNSSVVLQEEMIMQQQELLNSALQGVDGVASQEDQAFLEIMEAYNKEKNILMAKNKPAPRPIIFYDQTTKKRMVSQALELTSFLK